MTQTATCAGAGGLPREMGSAWRRNRGVTLLVCLATALMAVLPGCGPRPSSRVPAVAEAPPDIDALYREIQALEFVRGLGLSTEQAAKLVDALEPFEAELAQAKSDRRAQEQELVQLLQQQKAALLRGEATSDQTAARVAELRQGLLPERRLDPEQESRLAKAVRSVLSDKQVAAMPASLEARDQAQAMLDGFRELSADEFDAQIRPFAQDLVAQVPDVTPEQVEALFREARSLSEGEYKESLAKLTDQLLPLFTPSEEATDWLLADAFSQEGMFDVLRQIAGASGKATS